MSAAEHHVAAAAHPTDLDPGTHPARPAFTSDEQLVAWDRFREATEALHAAEMAHQQQAATLHATILAPAQTRFREALQNLTGSIVPGKP